MSASEIAIVKVVIATGGAVGAFFSLSRQSEPLTTKIVILYLSVGAVMAFFGTITAMHYIDIPSDDFDFKMGVAGLVAFFLGIISMNVAIFIHGLGILLRENPLKFLELISKFFGRLSGLFKGDKDA